MLKLSRFGLGSRRFPLTCTLPLGAQSRCGCSSGKRAYKELFAPVAWTTTIKNLESIPPEEFGRKWADASFKEQVVTVYEDSRNPYQCILYLLSHNQNGLLYYSLLKLFKYWIEPIQDQYSRYLNTSAKKQAFSIATSFDAVHFALANQVFDLKSISMEFIPQLREMLSMKQYLTIARCVSTLELYNSFASTENEILLNCVLIGEANVVADYLNSRTAKSKRNFIDLLNELCNSQTTIDEYLKKHKIATSENFVECRTLKYLGKIGRRLSKMFKFSIDEAPNLRQSRLTAGVRYLLHMRYTEKKLIDADFEDFVKNSVERNFDSVFELINALSTEFSDLPEAAKWAEHYSIEKDRLPCELLEFMENEEQENEDDVVPVGIDTEWSPGFGISNERMAVLQIAFADKVFLLDMLKLSEKLSDLEITTLIQKIFHNEKLLKLGYSFFSDIKVLKQTFPQCAKVIDNMTNTVCLRLLIDEMRRRNPACVLGIEQLLPKRLEPVAPTVTQIGTENSEKASNRSASMTDDDEPCAQMPSDALIRPRFLSLSLSVVCHYFLGKPLCKECTLSNWTRRPLSEQQTAYAALDAHVLLSLYQRLEETAQQYSITFSDAVKRSLVRPGHGHKPDAFCAVLSTDELTAQKQNVLSLLRELLDVTGPVTYSSTLTLPTAWKLEAANVRRPAEVKIVGDRMLSKLTKRLRTFGVDCDVLDKRQPRRDILKLAEQDDRFIVTRGRTVHKFVQYLPIKSVIVLPSCMSLVEEFCLFLRISNMNITTEDILSRCTACNSTEWTTVPVAALRPLWTFWLEKVVLPPPRFVLFGRKRLEVPMNVVLPNLRFKTAAPTVDSCQPTFDSCQNVIDATSLNVDLPVRSGLIQFSSIIPKVMDTAETLNLCQSCGHLMCVPQELWRQQDLIETHMVAVSNIIDYRRNVDLRITASSL